MDAWEAYRRVLGETNDLETNDLVHSRGEPGVRSCRLGSIKGHPLVR